MCLRLAFVRVCESEMNDSVKACGMTKYELIKPPQKTQSLFISQQSDGNIWLGDWQKREDEREKRRHKERMKEDNEQRERKMCKDKVKQN